MIVSKPRISVAIPTYRRGRILTETIDHLLAVEPTPAEILVVDQLPAHNPEVMEHLAALEEAGGIRWLRLDAASIPHAMNVGLLEAKNEIVLFVDDDVVPVPTLVAEHSRAHESEDPYLVVGRVFQPWGIADLEKQWESTEVNSAGYRYVEDFMGGNFSVGRSKALALGGFDENFVGAAYRYEAEFASRVRAAGGRILFAPKAEIRHLHVSSGGTRAYGLHLRTIRPYHSVGEYYFLLKGVAVRRRLRRLFVRPFRAIRTRFHLWHPWWIPISLVAEAAGFLWALVLWSRGPKYVKNT